MKREGIAFFWFFCAMFGAICALSLVAVTEGKGLVVVFIPVVLAYVVAAYRLVRE